MKNADLVIVATPISNIREVINETKPYLKKGVIVTDVGSAKENIGAS